MQSELFAEREVTFDLPDADLVYYPQFLADPRDYYPRLQREIQWRQDTIAMYGKPVAIPRLNAWYGDADAHYSYSGLQLQPLVWTETLLTIRARVEHLLGTSFNSVLANLYRDGNDSVAWHSDDEVELGDEPLIASVSLGATRRFSLRHRCNRQLATVHIDLQAGSLLVMRGPTQRYWHHRVAKEKAVTDGRINLTFRRIRPRR